MHALVSSYTSIFGKADRLSDIILPILARLVFAAVLLVYYWNSAGLKTDGSIFSPSAGAFGQIFPHAAEAVLYDVSQLNIFQRLVIFAGTVAEYVLPALILVGLLTRLAALGTIGFIWVQTIVDVTGHGVKLGSLFDNAIGLVDQRVMWTFLLLVLVFKGAGPLSLDALARRATAPAAA
ncbi:MULTISPECIES: DoxX family protein [Phaeobacter]|uniref:DoxX n=1 Tax=Phaeobacter piscinae TaxID=1580596 RepID=A0ABM6PEU9_9RHOB|nr:MULTISPECIES: DoxX family membrane protein [Phaeobacter]ATG36121.1 DoxX [Phaeobacter piscinae]ATG40005.1 DoxX [Phaeobacter piscinae]AUQ86642.1 DoxX [Phaeobacter piscinae]AUR24525.1 DoxX [Phaeobacter piscinae]KII14767.1 DoxX [Phaeobacter sp. S60]